MTSGVDQEAGLVADVPSQAAWQRLADNPRAVLVDVRTRAEWTFVGVPDLSALSRKAVLIEWQSFPGGQVDSSFQQSLRAALSAQGTTPDDEIFFICRSGGRSRMAAEVMADAGFRHCFNVSDGFEGPLDGARHRSTVAGWKHAGLAWCQS